MKELSTSLKLFKCVLVCVFLVIGSIQTAFAIEGDNPVRNQIVIQVSTDDPRTQTIALNNAVNLQKEYGLDNIDIEVVAYGPGLGLLTEKSGQAERVKSLAVQNITFSACGNTMNKIAKKTGKKPKVLEGVQVVKAGVSRIMQLQQRGYSYVRP